MKLIKTNYQKRVKMVSLETPVCEFDAPIVDFSLSGIDGEVWTPEKARGENGLLVMFICNHCPYVKSIRDRLVRDTRELLDHGVNSIAIMSNDPAEYEEDSFENMQKVADAFGFPFPYLFDESQQVAKAYGAVCTPDFFGYNKSMQLQYRGRLDASRKEAAADDVKRDLFDAMKQVAQTGRGPEQQIPSMGCSIKWKA
jgi:peroxiredoxin